METFWRVSARFFNWVSQWTGEASDYCRSQYQPPRILSFKDDVLHTHAADPPTFTDDVWENLK